MGHGVDNYWVWGGSVGPAIVQRDFVYDWRGFYVCPSLAFILFNAFERRYAALDRVARTSGVDCCGVFCWLYAV